MLKASSKLNQLSNYSRISSRIISWAIKEDSQLIFNHTFLKIRKERKKQFLNRQAFNEGVIHNDGHYKAVLQSISPHLIDTKLSPTEKLEVIDQFLESEGEGGAQIEINAIARMLHQYLVLNNDKNESRVEILDNFPNIIDFVATQMFDQRMENEAAIEIMLYYAPEFEDKIPNRLNVIKDILGNIQPTCNLYDLKLLLSKKLAEKINQSDLVNQDDSFDQVLQIINGILASLQCPFSQLSLIQGLLPILKSFITAANRFQLLSQNLLASIEFSVHFALKFNLSSEAFADYLAIIAICKENDTSIYPGDKFFLKILINLENQGGPIFSPKIEQLVKDLLNDAFGDFDDEEEKQDPTQEEETKERTELPKKRAKPSIQTLFSTCQKIIVSRKQEVYSLKLKMLIYGLCLKFIHHLSKEQFDLKIDEQLKNEFIQFFEMIFEQIEQILTEKEMEESEQVDGAEILLKYIMKIYTQQNAQYSGFIHECVWIEEKIDDLITMIHNNKGSQHLTLHYNKTWVSILTKLEKIMDHNKKLEKNLRLAVLNQSEVDI